VTDSGLQPDFADQYPSETSSTRAIYHGTRPPVYSNTSSSSITTTSPLPRLNALRGKSYRDRRLELGGVNSNPQPPDIEDWQNSTAEDGKSAASDDSWVLKEDQTSVTESTLADEMEDRAEPRRSESEERLKRRLMMQLRKESSK